MTDTYNGILLILKERKEILTCHTQINLKNMLSEVSHKRTNNVWFHLEQAPKVVKFRETESCWMIVARVLGGGGCVMRTYCLMGTESQFGTINFWRQMVAMFAQQREYILWVHLKCLKWWILWFTYFTTSLKKIARIHIINLYHTKWLIV